MIISRGGNVYSQGDKIEPITLGCDGRHMGHIMDAAMREPSQQKSEDTSLLRICTATRRWAPKIRGGKGASVHQNSSKVVITPEIAKVVT